MCNHKVIFGDSRKMSLLPDRSVQLVITSPPYWQLKDYGKEEQIGFNDSYEEYINHLNLVWQECCRVLADGCRMCVNIGDQFARSVYYGRYKVIPIRTEIIRFCETLGMDYMGAIIWQKTTTMNTTGGGAIMGSFPYPRNGILKMDYEFILIFKKLGTAPKPTAEQKAQSELTKEEWKQYFSSHWNFNGVKQTEHIAMFPEELPKRLIKMFSFAGETVLDPFLGSGTTSLAAEHLNRNSIGYEINATYRPYIQQKLSEISEERIAFLDEAQDPADFTLDTLPYLFHDPHKMDKKLDIRKTNYGSRIGSAPKKQTEELFGVREILSPECLILSNGMEIRLLGVRTKPGREQEAIDFLAAKTAKRKVFLRDDPKISSAQGRKPCYLYLDNKTFVNRHLVRTGFVDVDTESEYKYKEKFIQDQQGEQ